MKQVSEDSPFFSYFAHQVLPMEVPSWQLQVEDVSMCHNWGCVSKYNIHAS